MYDLRSLAILIVTAPLVGGVISGLFGRYLGRVLVHCLTTLLVGVSFFASAYVMYGFVNGDYQVWDQSIYVWAQSGNLDISIGFLLDKLSVLMITIVSFISFMVHIYTIGYMHDDPGYQRFFSYISLFTFGMLMLCMADNFVQLFFGWEAVGLMSYLLIGFWFKKPTAIFANLKAFLVNRVGDFGFILGIAAVLHYCGSLHYANAFAAIPGLISNQAAINLICGCLFVGAMAKSAQIPLHVWLPDSMEGPTPISALIHAATMVTAGVFMVARMSPIFEHSELVLNYIIIIGSATCLFMGILAIVQRDIKRIIAYSTLSQLGYMVVALGVSAYSASIFHLVTHAFFKALLFLGAGSVIIAMHHEQDIFNMGNLIKYMPVTFVCMLIGTLAIVGLPGMSGFYSKDLIIEAVRASSLPAAAWAYYVILGGVFITALYSFRLLFVVFYNKERMTETVRVHLHEPSKVILLPLILLAIPSIMSGSLLVKYIVNGFFENSIFVVSTHDVIAAFATDHFESVVAMFMKGFISMPFLMLVLGFAVSWLCYIKYPNIPVVIQRDTKFIARILNYKYGFDLFNERLIMPAVKALGGGLWRIGDIMCIDGIMVNGSAKSIGVVSGLLRRIQTGYLYHYAFAMIAGFFVLGLWLLVIR